MGETGQQAGAGDDALPSRPGEGESALLCAPAMDRRGNEACLDLLQVDDLEALNFLGVLLDESIDEALDRWRAHAGGLPGEVAVVSAEDQMRGVAASAGGGAAVSYGADVKTATVAEPGDLTGLGIKTSQCLSAWSEDEGTTVVCFHSLTTLLQYAELQKVFQFLHVLTQRIRASGARAHFHIDPNAHTDQEMATLRSLFDRVYQVGPDGTWSES